MTPQIVTTFDITEIPALEIVCQCGSRISIPFLNWNLPVMEIRCVGCDRALWESPQDHSRVAALALLKAFVTWRDLQQKKFKIEFSIKQSISQK